MNFASLLTQTDSAVRAILGDEVTYAPSSGAPVTVTGIFDSAYVLVDAGQAGLSSSGPAVFLSLADLPSDPMEDLGAMVTEGGISYVIREAAPDGKGGVLLHLHKA